MRNTLRRKLDDLRARFGKNRVEMVLILLMVGVASITVRLLIGYGFHKSALLYVGVPYLVAVMIALFRPQVADEKVWWHRYRDDLLQALMVLLGSSIVLFEGFVCVVFLLPIFLFMVLIAFLLGWVRARARESRGTHLVSLLPLLVVALSLEGTTPSLSLDRHSQVVVSKVTTLTPDRVLENMARPFDLRKRRHWLLRIFPMPYEIQAGSLTPGDVHVVKTRYHRWFFTNTHEGELHLQIGEVESNRVTTTFIHDSTYFSSYLKPLGTQITLDQIAPGQTRVTLQIDYERSLDPAWYFHPLQQFGVSKMGEFLIDEVMIRGE